MSLRSKLTEKLFKSSIEKSFYALKPIDMYGEADRQNKDRDFEVPEDKAAVYEAVKLCGEYDCLLVSQGKGAAKAVLYLYEGVLLKPDDGDLQLAVKLGRDTGKDVWLPYIPILPEDYIIDDMIDAVADAYAKMTEKYGEGNVEILGFGFGATLGIVLHLLMQTGKIPSVPAAKIIAISPQVTVYDMEVMSQMVIADPLDVRRDSHYTDFLTTYDKIWGEDRYDARKLFTGVYGDYSRMPETWLYYGGSEVLRETAPFLEASFKASANACHMTIGKDMMHSYPQMTFIPEGKAAYKQIVGILKG